MKFGAKLKYLREQAGMTQEELGLKLSLRKQTISQYENERREPSTKIMQQISNIFGISLDQLLDDVTFESEPKIVLYGSDGRLVDISSLSKEDQDYILNLAERFKNERR